MAGELAIPKIGNEVIDELRQLQLWMNNDITDPLEMRSLFYSGVSCVPLKSLNEQVDVTGSEALAKSLDLARPDERLRLRRPISFMGNPKQVAFSLVANSITVMFANLEVAPRLEDEMAAMVSSPDLFRLHDLEIPVLAIESWARAA